LAAPQQGMAVPLYSLIKAALTVPVHLTTGYVCFKSYVSFG